MTGEVTQHSHTPGDVNMFSLAYASKASRHKASRLANALCKSACSDPEIGMGSTSPLHTSSEKTLVYKEIRRSPKPQQQGPRAKDHGRWWIARCFQISGTSEELSLKASLHTPKSKPLTYGFGGLGFGLSGLGSSLLRGPGLASSVLFRT